MSFEMIPYKGEIMAVLTAMIWALAVICFKKSGETVHPIALNLLKIVLGIILIFLTMLPMAELWPDGIGLREYAFMLLSGIIGISISDTLFFKCLNTLGAGLTAIVDCLYSPFVIFLCFCWIDERMKVLQLLGVALILSAVLTAASRKGGAGLSRKQLWAGLTYGVLAMFTVAVSIVMIKPMLGYVPMLWAIEVRLIGSLIGLLVILAFHPQRMAVLQSFGGVRQWQYGFWGSVLGGYLSMVLWVAGMKYTQASIAAALNQTSNIFIFTAAALFLHEPLNRQRVLGIVLAVGGVLLIILV